MISQKVAWFALLVGRFGAWVETTGGLPGRNRTYLDSFQLSFLQNNYDIDARSTWYCRAHSRWYVGQRAFFVPLTVQSCGHLEGSTSFNIIVFSIIPTTFNYHVIFWVPVLVELKLQPETAEGEKCTTSLAPPICRHIQILDFWFYTQLYPSTYQREIPKKWLI